MTRQTLAQWLQEHPQGGDPRQHGPFVIVPAPSNESHYAAAFRLADHVMWNVSGGAMWFARRDTPLS